MEDRIDLVDPERLKEELAARYPTDREAYTEGKTAFVAAALAGSASRRFSS